MRHSMRRAEKCPGNLDWRDSEEKGVPFEERGVVGTVDDVQDKSAFAKNASPRSDTVEKAS